MQDTSGCQTMAKKRSEERRHSAMTRVDAAMLERARLAASLMKMSLADYVTLALSKTVEKDISREAKKLTGGDK